MSAGGEGAIKTVGWGPFALRGERQRLRKAEARRLREVAAIRRAEPAADHGPSQQEQRLEGLPQPWPDLHKDIWGGVSSLSEERPSGLINWISHLVGGRRQRLHYERALTTLAMHDVYRSAQFYVLVQARDSAGFVVRYHDGQPPDIAIGSLGRTTHMETHEEPAETGTRQEGAASSS